MEQVRPSTSLVLLGAFWVSCASSTFFSPFRPPCVKQTRARRHGTIGIRSHIPVASHSLEEKGGGEAPPKKKARP